MKLVSIKFAVSLAWVVAVIAVSLTTGPHSRASWGALVAAALVPSWLLMWWWNDPVQTLSETLTRRADRRRRPTANGARAEEGARGWSPETAG
jgi:hypothetical protein